MAWGTWRGWPTKIPDEYITTEELPGLLPQLLKAGMWEPKSTNTHLATQPLHWSAMGDFTATVIEFPKSTTDEWYFLTKPPKNWISEKIIFTVDWWIVDSLGTPESMIWELGAEYAPDNFDPDTIVWQTQTVTKTPPDSTIPKLMISSESAELTITGSPADSGDLLLRIKRGSDVESDALYFDNVTLTFV